MGVEQSRAESGVVFRDRGGIETNATVIQATRQSLVFELYSPSTDLRVGEVVENVTLYRSGRPVFSGAAEIKAVLSTGLTVIVTAAPRSSWSQFDAPELHNRLFADAQALIADWDAAHALIPQYQLAVGNVRTFLSELSRWAAPMDLVAGASDASYMPEAMEKIAEHLFDVVRPRLKQFFDEMEQASVQVPADRLAVHRAFARRELHPYVLCAPFCHRAFTKPLGYAGDYEMVNMIMRNRMEGPSMYAKLVNAYFLRIDVAEAHRNRIEKLVDMLQSEARRAASAGGPLRVMSLGCGPAEEICRLIRREPLADRCEFTLIDFNQETLDYAAAQIEAAMRDSGRTVKARFVKRSVGELLKDASRSRGAPSGGAFDVVMCAGLFDYLTDRVCSRLLDWLYDRALPDGLVVATNVHPRHTAHAILGDLSDWHLIVRSEADMRALLSQNSGTASVGTEPAGVNVFLEVRKTGGVNDRGDRTQQRVAACTSLPGV